MCVCVGEIDRLYERDLKQIFVCSENARDLVGSNKLFLKRSLHRVKTFQLGMYLIRPRKYIELNIY